MGGHMERIVGRQPAHLDNDRGDAGRELHIPRRIDSGDEEHSDVESSYLRRPGDDRYYDEDRREDSVCDVT
jgi:hypothetical protein